MLDGLFDIGYTIINAIRMNVQKAPIGAIDALALMLPVCSFIEIMVSYAQFSIRESERRKERRMPQRGRSRRSSYQLPHQSMGSDVVKRLL